MMNAGTAIAPLTDAQRRSLEHAIRCADQGEYDGVSPKGFRQRAMFAYLEQRGFLTYVGEGENHDDNQNVRQVSIYAITDDGRKVIAATRRIYSEGYK